MSPPTRILRSPLAVAFCGSLRNTQWRRRRDLSDRLLAAPGRPHPYRRSRRRCRSSDRLGSAGSCQKTCVQPACVSWRNVSGQRHRGPQQGMLLARDAHSQRGWIGSFHIERVPRRASARVYVAGRSGQRHGQERGDSRGGRVQGRDHAEDRGSRHGGASLLRRQRHVQDHRSAEGRRSHFHL